MRRSAVLLCGLWLAVAAAAAAQPGKVGAHALAMHGEPAYGPDFEHFRYVKPDAPRGGELRQAGLGTFDTFNPFIVKGNPVLRAGLLYDTLTVESADEPFSEYGLLAERIETPEDRSQVVFALRPEARWHDGRPVDADDVLWTFRTLLEHGAPFYRFYYGSVAAAEKLGPRRVRFRFREGSNRELPLILGQLAVLPRHYWEGRDFTSATLEPPLGSGPYRIADFEPGRHVVYERVPDYWGRALPVKVGQHNFDRIRIDYYRDDRVALEAFKGGEYDFRLENNSKDWATAYEIPQVREGRIRLERVPHQRTAPMQGFVMNTRRPLFRDRRVRAALAQAFDFEWSNRALFYGQYTRTRSYFDNSELAATGTPGPEELALLEPFRGRVPDEVFAAAYQPPRTDGSGRIRARLQRAVGLLREAGFVTREGTLVHGESGQPFRFEILLVQPDFERVVLPFAKNLARIGIHASVRTVDTSQYRKRLDEFDFDVIVGGWAQSSSPGNEQRDFWGSEAAERPGSRNYAGIRDPVVDALVEQLIAAPDREALVARSRALDRVLQWGHYVIPHYHIAADRVAYWDVFGRPEVVPRAGLQLDAWWIDPAKRPPPPVGSPARDARPRAR